METRKGEFLKLTIGVPTYNSPEAICAAIDSLFTHTDVQKFDVHVYIINNGNTIPLVSGNGVTVIEAGENLGWMRGVNEALRHTEDEGVFAMMNDDLLFVPGSPRFWTRMVDLALHPDVGLVGPSSNYISGYQNAFWVSPMQYVECPYIIGMLSMFDMRHMDKVGFLDESLPGGDDIDFSIRHSKWGHKLVCARESYVHHIGSLTGRREQPTHWDSHRHQSLTYNALIKKHGFKTYFDLLNRPPKEFYA